MNRGLVPEIGSPDEVPTFSIEFSMLAENCQPPTKNTQQLTLITIRSCCHGHKMLFPPHKFQDPARVRTHDLMSAGPTHYQMGNDD